MAEAEAEVRRTDAELLAEYVRSPGQTSQAFEQIVARHGGMVYSTCLRVLGEQEAAQDAAQTAFCVLARKAGSVRGDLGGFLHKVALDAARMARRAELTRQRHEKEAAEMVARREPEAGSDADATWAAVRPHLDEALERLPAPQRSAVVLHYLEGLTREQTARAMGVEEGTVSSHLSRGLDKLREHLARRGAMVSLIGLGGVLAGRVAEASCPPFLLAAAGKLASAGASAVGAGAVSAQVATLTKGVLQAMFWTKVKLVAASTCLAVVTMVAAGAVGLQVAAGGDGPAVAAAEKVIKGQVTKVEDGKDGAKAATISVGKADGVKEGFEFTCKAKGWTGKVTAVAEASSVLDARGEVAVGDQVETKLSTVLAEKKPDAAGGAPKADPNANPEPAPIKPEQVAEGLQLSLVKKESVRKFTVLTDKDGNPVRVREGQKPPEGAVEKVQESKHTELSVQLKNVGDKPVVLGFPFGASGGQGGMMMISTSAGPLKFFAKDAEGKEVPRMDFGRMRQPAADAPKDENKPAVVTIIKPGQTLEQQVQWLPINFPAEAKYTVWATLEEQPKDEVLPGFKPWSGKLKSNEVEWDNRGRGNPWGRPGGGRDGGGRDGGGRGNPGAPTVPPGNPDKEVF